jgi:dihydrofolate reductase
VPRGSEQSPANGRIPGGDVLDHWQNSTPITGDIIGKITRPKQQPGKNIMIPGSATLVRCLLHEGLLDELRLLLFPLVLGGGERLFDDWAARLPLQQVELLMLDTGSSPSATSQHPHDAAGPRARVHASMCRGPDPIGQADGLACNG